MPAALQASTLVLCRSGAATLSELAVLGKPSILVPLPPAIGSSPQEANAEMFGRKAAAEVIRDAEMKPEMLVERVISIIASSTRLESMAKAVLSFAKPQAAQVSPAGVMIMPKRNRSGRQKHTHGWRSSAKVTRTHTS